VTIETFDVVLYTAIFLLPGYIIKSTFDIFIPPPKHNDTKYFFTCLLYSIINFAVWSWAYILVINNIDGVKETKCLQQSTIKYLKRTQPLIV